jgi:two-component system copper resistance phosphate regulon response regulator CusR
MKILIVEDERKTAAYLKRGLEENGFIADVAEDGAYLAKTRSYDLIILDVMLPGQDGWSIIADLRRRQISTSVLFLTARDGVDDRVKGLELGADDYLVKPFAFAELLARTKTILRRGPVRQSPVLNVLDLELDLSNPSYSPCEPAAGPLRVTNQYARRSARLGGPRFITYLPGAGG